MANQIQRFEPNNTRLYEMIRQTCYGLVEEGDKAQELLAIHSSNLAAIDALVDQELFSKIEDVVYQVASVYGFAMFDLGVTIGKDPTAILDLPDTTGPYSF